MIATCEFLATIKKLCPIIKMTRLIIILTLIPTLLKGQQFKKVATPTDTFFVLNSSESLTNHLKLPNGTWKVYFDNDTSRLHYLFNLNDNKVNGFFMSYYSNGKWAAIGTYKDDSLWTFITDKYEVFDTTYKICCWRYQTSLPYPMEGGRPMDEEHLYYIPFAKEDSIFKDRWFDIHGRLLSERIYHKSIGLLTKTWYDNNGNQTSFVENHENYSMKTNWTKNQSISEITIDQIFHYSLQLDTSKIEFNPCHECILQTVSDKADNLISQTSLDSKGKIRYFYGGGVTLHYDEKGEIKTVQYWNKKGKLKFKNLK